MKRKKLSYCGHIIRKTNCLEKDLKDAHQDTEQGSTKKTLHEEKTSIINGLGYTSMWQQDLQKTENSRTLCMSLTLQLEDGTRRRDERLTDTYVTIVWPE